MKPHRPQRWNIAFSAAALAVAAALAAFTPAAHAAPVLLSQGKAAVASSVEGPFVAASAVDGDPGTRWGSAFGDPQWIYVDLGATAAISRVVLTWEAAFGRAYQIQVSGDAVSWTTIFSTTTGDGATDDLAVAGTGRYVRMNGTARGTAFGYSLWEFQVFGEAATAATLLSQGKPAVASSIEGAFVAGNAVDGNAVTRWGSAFSDPQWIYVDLGATATISRVVLTWEAAFGRAYQIQVSGNATTWTTIFSTTTGDGGTDDLAVAGSGRYVRMNGTARGTAFGYSLFEFQVFGTGGGGGGTCAAPPGVPTGLVASGVTGDSLNLAWNAPAAGANCTITGYQVFRNGTLAASPAGTGALITGLGPSTTYAFTVAAVNAFGASAQSAPLSVTTGTGPGTRSRRGFWDTSGIPVAKNAMTFKFLNRSNGRYPDSQMYWAFTTNGATQVHSFAQAPTFDMPANSAGRMYFYIVTDPTDPVIAADPTKSPYFDFIEFTIGGTPTVCNVNTTRVDVFGLKLALRLHTAVAEDTVGKDYRRSSVCEATFAKFIAETPPEFAHLAQPPFAPFRIVEPGAGNFRQGGSQQHYMDSWVDQLWASNGITAPKPTFFCNPIVQPDLSAACYRHVGLGALNPNGTLKAGNPLWSSSAPFYAAAPAHYYARFWHAHAHGGKAYGFPYDDVGGYSSFVARPNPQYMLVAVGW